MPRIKRENAKKREAHAKAAFMREPEPSVNQVQDELEALHAPDEKSDGRMNPTTIYRIRAAARAEKAAPKAAANIDALNALKKSARKAKPSA